jgi:hypothetical protein
MFAPLVRSEILDTGETLVAIVIYTSYLLLDVTVEVQK